MFTNSITNAAYYPERNDLVQMMNSLSANLDVMRPSMLETGLESMAYNFNRRNQHLKFFEFGKVYTRQDEKFQETEMLALFVSATVQLPHWSMSPRQADIYYLRGLIEALFPQLVFVFEEMNSGLNILYRNQPIGQILQVSLERLKQMDIKQEVWYAELNWTILKKALEQTKVVFQDIPKFPVVWRDLSLVVDKKVAYADIQKAVRQAKSKLLREVNLFDIFESEKLGKDKISYALNFSFYDQQKTLTDAEIESEMSVLLKSLQEKVGASIRN
jgi:phenylalanyl-tRNA synthetase beta chain